MAENHPVWWLNHVKPRSITMFHGETRFFSMVKLQFVTHRIHGAAIYGNMDPINIPPLC